MLKGSSSSDFHLWWAMEQKEQPGQMIKLQGGLNQSDKSPSREAEQQQTPNPCKKVVTVTTSNEGQHTSSEGQHKSRCKRNTRSNDVWTEP